LIFSTSDLLVEVTLK